MLGTVPMAEAVACTLCGRPLAGTPAHLHNALEPALLRRLRAAEPAWEAPDGVCPECLRTAVAGLHAQRSAISLHNELGHSYPVYDREELNLLPTPLRMRANPNYTGRG